MTQMNRTAAVVAACVLSMVLMGIAGGFGPAAPSGFGVEIAEQGKIQVELHDVELMDQDGNLLKFGTEVVGDRVAVLIPFYTNCTTSYPILIFIFTRLQNMLGERLNRDVVLISATVDPRNDSPARLKAFADKQKARPGWFFLSGDRNSLGQMLCGMNVLPSSNLEEHNHIPVTVVGSVKEGWRRFPGFPTPDQLLAQVDQVLAAAQAP